MSLKTFLFLAFLTQLLLIQAENINKVNLVQDLLRSEQKIKIIKYVGCLNENNFLLSLVKNYNELLSVRHHNLPTELNLQEDRPWAHQTLFITDFHECPQLFESFTKIDKFFLEHPFHWLFFLKKSEMEIFQNLFISIGSNIVVAVQDPLTGSFELKQIYKVRSERNRTYEENYGNWSNSTGLVDGRSSKVIAVRRKNLKKEVLIVSVTFITNASYEHAYDYNAKEVDAAIRTIFYQMDVILKTFNATLRFDLQEKFGYDETGIWVGSYGSLINDHADIAAAPFFVQARRIDVIDYIDTISPFRPYFIFRFPNLSTVKNIYVLPFNRTVWLCLGAFIVISVLTAFFMMRSEANLIKNSRKRSIYDVILLILSIVCQMGSELEARILSTRIFIFFSFFTSIFVFTSYTANIVALLQTPTKSIQTLHDLYESKLDLGIEDNMYNRYYVGKTTDPLRLKIFKEKIAPPNKEPRFFDRKSGVAMMRNSSFAFFAESGPIFREIEATFYESEKCNLNMIEYLEVIEPYQALKKNSPYREIMKISLPRLREFGITKAEVNRMYKKRPTCSDGAGSHFESVSVESIRGALLLLPYGLAFALAVFIAEILYTKIKNRRTHPK